MSEHHPWCNFWTKPQATCKQCAWLYKHYQFKEGETPDDAQKRFFPDAKPRHHDELHD